LANYDKALSIGEVKLLEIILLKKLSLSEFPGIAYQVHALAFIIGVPLGLIITWKFSSRRI